MVILPHDNVLVRIEDVIEGLNRAPQPGDGGHTDDHAKLTQVVFDVPQTTVSLGMAAKDPESGWFLRGSTNLSAEMEPATWAQVLDFVDRPGIVAVAADPHSAADGVTDHADDSGMDGLAFYIFASGVVGLTHAVADLIQQVNALKAAQE